MKNIHLLSIAVILFISCSNSNQINSLSANGLKGKVKTVTSACYDATERFGDIQKGNLIASPDYWLPLYAGIIQEFDRGRNLSKETYLDENGKVYRVIKYEYKGNNSIATYLYESDGELSSSWKMIFKDDVPVTLERYNRYLDTKNETIKCVFDGLNVITEKHYKDGDLIQQDVNEYKNNLLYKSISTDKDGNITFQLEQDFTINGQFKYRHYIQNGENGILENISYNDKELPVQYSRTGDWSNGDVDCTFEYTEFDKQGNWITRIIKVEGQPVVVQERVIEYY